MNEVIKIKEKGMEEGGRGGGGIGEGVVGKRVERKGRERQRLSRDRVGAGHDGIGSARSRAGQGAYVEIKEEFMHLALKAGLLVKAKP